MIPKFFLKTIKMLFGMIGIFGINWLPIHLFNFYTAHLYLRGDLNQNNFKEIDSYPVAYYTCHILSLSCTFVNPICLSFATNSFKVFI